MAVGIDTFGANFIHYLPGVIEILNDEVNAKRLTKGTVKDWEGSKLVKHVHVNRSASINFAQDGGAIPPSKKQGYQAAECYRKFITGSVGVTDGALDNASSTEHAAIRVVDSELRNMMIGIKKFLNYFWSRDGTGIVTRLGATTSGATITVDDARGLWDKGEYTLLDTDGSTVHTTFEVKSVARSYNNTLGSATVTPTSSVSAAGQAADDYVVWGTGPYSSYGNAIIGLDAGIDDAASTFQGIDASIWTKYTSPVIDSVGQLTPAVLRKMLAMLTQEGGKPPEGMTVIGNSWGCVLFDELYESEMRITPDTSTVGTATPSFQSSMGTIKIEQDPDSPYGMLFFMDPSQITYAVQRELHWRPNTNGGSGIFVRDDGRLRYTATALETAELFYEQRNRLGKLTGITEDVGSAY